MGERNIGWDGNLGFASIGAHAHESGHSFGLPDLYDATYQTNGVGGYSLMGLGNYGALINNHARPVHPLAYEKIRLGFFNPEPVISNSLNKNVPSIKLSPYALKVQVWNYGQSLEYFLIENRQPLGFDSEMPTGGILITHFYSANPNTFKIDIEEIGGIAADGCGIQSNLFPLDFNYRPPQCGNYHNARVEENDLLNLTNQVFSPWSSPNSNLELISGSSTNVAVVFKNKNGTSCIIDVYRTNPLDAPPSKPQNLKTTLLDRWTAQLT